MCCANNAKGDKVDEKETKLGKVNPSNDEIVLEAGTKSESQWQLEGSFLEEAIKIRTTNNFTNVRSHLDSCW